MSTNMKAKLVVTSVLVFVLLSSARCQGAQWEKLLGYVSPVVTIDGERPYCAFGVTFHRDFWIIESPATITTYDMKYDSLGRLVEYRATGTGNGHPIETHVYAAAYNGLGQVTSYDEDRYFPESGNEYHIEISNATYNSVGRVEDFDATVEPDIQEIISRCNVRAGRARGQGRDTISFSGTLGATETDFLNAMGTDLVVSIDAAGMPIPLDFTFPVNTVSFRNGRYNARTVNGATSSFRFNTRNGRADFNARNVDLTGLACPVTVTVTIGSYSSTFQLDEDVVNGTRRPCPLQLLMGVIDSLTVDRARVSLRARPNADSLSVSGSFTINGTTYDKTSPLVIQLGSDTQTFTVPGNQMILRGTREMCSRVVPLEGGSFVSVTFDFSRCTYSISITKADITESGTVDFGVVLFDKDLRGFASVDL